MTVVLDAFAVIAAVAGEPAAAAVEHELRQPGADVWISAVNYAEVFDQLIRVARLDGGVVEASMQLLEAAGMRVAPLDPHAGNAAGMLRARHYRRRLAELSLADCCALALATSLDAQLATADPALIAAAAAEGIRVLALPGSS